MKYQHRGLTRETGIIGILRNRLIILTIFTVLGICLVSTSVAAETLTGRDIMLKVKERPEGDDSGSLMKMVLVNRKNLTKERSFLSFKKKYGNDQKTLMYFQEPADIRGTGFLTWEYDKPGKDDDRWIYLPSLKKSRRISGSSKNSYFLGSDFTYDDMGDRAVDEDDHTLIREEEIDGKKCWVVESKPKDPKYMYSKKIYWIWQEAFFGLVVEYYDRMGTLLKKLTVQDLRKKDGFQTPFKMTMDNIRKKHKTIFITEEIHYNQGLEDSLFRVTTLERGSIK